MKKTFFGLIFILLGSGLWWALSNTARFSIKKWDAKFDGVLRHSLEDTGVQPKDVLGSVNEIKQDSNGQYVVHRMTLKMMDKGRRTQLVRSLELAGADVKERADGAGVVLEVTRGSRLYQEISFLSPQPAHR